MKRLFMLALLVLVGVAITQRLSIALGVIELDRAQLEEARSSGRRLRRLVVGILDIGSDVTPELATQSIELLRVVGVLRAPRPVWEALSGRTLVVGTEQPH